MVDDSSFGDVDPEWAAWQAAHPSWRLCGLDAVHAVASERQHFTTVDVWRVWRGPEPEEPRSMSAVMDEAIAQGLCVRSGVAGGHARRAGHAGFGSVYVSLIRRG